MHRLMLKFKILALLPGLFLLLGFPAAAEVVEKVVQDLEPISGVLVLPAAEQSVIDLDAEDGVHPGDLFSVLGAGEKIVHPETGETLGTLETVKGVLQVRRVDEGFSLATPLLEEESFARGDTVRRNYKIPALFWDYTGGGEALYLQLREQLPDLNWTAYSKAQTSRPTEPAVLSDGKSGLLFVLSDRQTLEVRDNQFELLKSYTVPSGLVTKKEPSASAPSAIVSTPQAQQTQRIVTKEKPSEEGIWYGPDFTDNPVGIEVGNMDGEDGLEVATLFENRLEIGRFIGRKYTKTAEVDLGHGQKALLLDGADLNDDGIMELYITASADGHLASMVVEQAGSDYEVSEDFIRRYFRKISLPGEGPVLLGQRMGTPRKDFSGPVYRVQREGGELTEGKPVDLPRQLNVLNFTPLGSDKVQAFARLSNLGDLEVLDPDGDRLWQSVDDFGGSESFIERPDPQESPETGDATRNHYMTARFLKLSGDTVLVPANEGTDFIQRLQVFKRSSLKAMQWNGHVMNEVWHTKQVDAYMPDFRIADVNGDGREEILMALVFSRKGMFSKGRSSLMAVELP